MITKIPWTKRVINEEVFKKTVSKRTLILRIRNRAEIPWTHNENLENLKLTRQDMGMQGGGTNAAYVVTPHALRVSWSYNRFKGDLISIFIIIVVPKIIQLIRFKHFRETHTILSRHGPPVFCGAPVNHGTTVGHGVPVENHCSRKFVWVSYIILSFKIKYLTSLNKET